MHKRVFSAPRIEDLGAMAELTNNGFSMGNDVGKGKSGRPGGMGIGMGMGGPAS